MKLNLEQLKKVAKAAIPYNYPTGAKNDFRKEFNPSVALVLIDKIEKLEQENTDQTYTIHSLIDYGVPGTMYPGSHEEKLMERIKALEGALILCQKQLATKKIACKAPIEKDCECAYGMYGPDILCAFCKAGVPHEDTKAKA